MRILYLSQYFPPEMGAPAARVSELATRWAADGHDVAVLTGFPHHPTGIVPPQYRGRMVARETHRGVKVLRSYVYATPNRGVFRRSLSYGSFAASSVLMGALSSDLRARDVLIATSPQFLCAVSGYALSKALQIPFVLEIRDLWPQSIVEVGAMSASNPVITGLRRLERFLYDRADRLVGVTDSFARTWVGQGIDPAKIRVVKNGVDLRRFEPRPVDDDLRSELGVGDAFVVAYIGTHGLAHGLETLLEAAHAVRDDGVHLVMVGEGAQRQTLIAFAKARGITNVTFVGERPRDEIPRYLAAADLVAVVLRPADLFKQVIPSKIFEIMGCARPILLGVAGEAEEIVREAGAGLVVTPGDAVGMAEAIRGAMRDRAGLRGMGAAGRAFVEERFDRDRLAREYLEVLGEVVGKGNGSGRGNGGSTDRGG